MRRTKLLRTLLRAPAQIEKRGQGRRSASLPVQRGRLHMRRRDFVACCASGFLVASVPTLQGAENQGSNSGSGAISALKAAKQLQVYGKFEEMRKAFHSDALFVEPGSLTPIA